MANRLRKYLIVGLNEDADRSRFADTVVARSPADAEEIARDQWPDVEIAAVIRGRAEVVA